MTNDLMKIESQMYKIVNGISGIDKLLTSQLIQCAFYKIREQENDPHAQLIMFRRDYDPVFWKRLIYQSKREIIYDDRSPPSSNG